mgnify:FL=1
MVDDLALLPLLFELKQAKITVKDLIWSVLAAAFNYTLFPGERDCSLSYQPVVTRAP